MRQCASELEVMRKMLKEVLLYHLREHIWVEVVALSPNRKSACLDCSS